MDFVLGWRKLFSFLPVLLAAVGVCGDTCKVTHQGKATTYNISNPKSNPTCDYSWADSNLLVLATDAEPEGKGIISSSHSSLTLLGCWKNVCVTIYCHLKHHTTCCYTNCPAAPEPPADCTAAPEPQADFTAAPEPPVGAFGDTCTVTHQGKATTYNISNPKSNPTCEYSWADSNGTILATEEEPNNGGTSSSHSSLTLLGCLKNVCVETMCHLKLTSLLHQNVQHHTTCCYTNCPAAPEPPADFTAAPEPPADFTAAPEPPADFTAAPEPPADFTAAPEPPADCTAAPEPQADFTAAPEPPADFTAAPEPPADCTAAPEPQADFTAAPEPPADFTAAPEPPADFTAAPEPPADCTAAPEPQADFTAAPEPPVGAFGDTCTVTHQGKATTYNISNPKSNPTCEYSWADSNLLVLATDAEPEGKGIISSSHSSLTLLGCWKNACVTIYCHLKPHTTCCYTNCTDAPEPQANFTAAPEPQADFTAAPEPPEHIDPMNCRDYWIVVRIPVVIVLLMVMVIAVVCCRKKENSWLERFNRACSSKEPQSGSGEDARPEVIPMLDV
ncbi:uncharacterized protein LOC115547203 isoform X6 [Gadus morhua]|uniref:uncharacterized protein LOC115547203 isoform X4 n=1 Tax=Gadus morhua TaxID=8049 RepID=UPI0011B4F17B|nr:uncharacterized protein LOC115547203 isoform X4 [Gadus morhua]XP_030217075.1 uncharacterized protein LOC115547203 isoform X6 [Gadus morhua]